MKQVEFRKIFLLAYLCLLNIHIVWSQELTNDKKTEKHNDKKSLSDINVSASRKGYKNPDENTNVVYISEDENRSENYLSDILNKQTGVIVNRYGASGSFSTLSIRGNGSHQTNVYVDGVLLNDVLGGFINIEDLPIDLFSKAEIFRSYVPNHLPGGNIGGAVDLIPRLPKKKKKSLLFRSFGQSLYGGGLSLGFTDKNQIHLAHFEGSLNQYNYLDDNGTKLFNFQDDEIRKRENEDYLQGSFTSILRIPFSEKNLKVFLSYLGKERGLPGPLTMPLKDVRYESHRIILKPSIDYVFSNHFLLNASAGFTGQYSNLEDISDELTFIRPDQKRYSLRSEQALKPSLFLFSDRLILRSSLSYAYNRIYLESQVLGERSETESSFSMKYTPLTWLGYINLGGKYLNVSDTPGETYQTILFLEPFLETTRSNILNGNLRFSFYILDIFNKMSNIKEKTKKKKYPFELFGILAYAERPASLSERYGDGAFLLPNSELNKESSITYSIGLDGALPCPWVSCFLFISYFHSKADDLILLIGNSLGTAKYFNISASKTNGVELKLRSAYSHYFLLDLKGTYLKAIDDSDIPFYRGKFLPFKPMYSINIYMEGGFKRIRSFTNIVWQGQVYRDRFNQRANSIPHRFLIDLGFIYYFPKNKKYSLIFKIKNILGRFQSDVLDYPLPGRYFEVKFLGELNL